MLLCSTGWWTHYNDYDSHLNEIADGQSDDSPPEKRNISHFSGFQTFLSVTSIRYKYRLRSGADFSRHININDCIIIQKTVMAGTTDRCRVQESVKAFTYTSEPSKWTVLAHCCIISFQLCRLLTKGRNKKRKIKHRRSFSFNFIISIWIS